MEKLGVILNATVLLYMVLPLPLLFWVISRFLISCPIPAFYADIPDFYTKLPC